MNSPARRLAYVALGSNLGDKAEYIKQALALLNDGSATRVLRVAPFYRTAPVGYTDQDWFVNTVAEVETELVAPALLRLLLELEDRLGRVRDIRWGPRTIDLDLLLYDMEIIHTPTLIVPHPRMHQRAFVMLPLADLVPEREIPGRGKAAKLALLLKKEQEIEML